MIFYRRSGGGGCYIADDVTREEKARALQEQRAAKPLDLGAVCLSYQIFGDMAAMRVLHRLIEQEPKRREPYSFPLLSGALCAVFLTPPYSKRYIIQPEDKPRSTASIMCKAKPELLFILFIFYLYACWRLIPYYAVHSHKMDNLLIEILQPWETLAIYDIPHGYIQHSRCCTYLSALSFSA